MKKRTVLYALLLSFLFQIFTIQTYALEIQCRETIASANGRIYAISKDGSLYYWGKGTFNDSVGDQSIDRSKPVKLMDNVIGVYGDWWSGFAVKSDNTLWAIGDSGDGKGGMKEDTDPPVKIMDNVKEAACGYGSWILLKTDGTVWTWDYYTNKIPKKVISDIKQISAGMESFYAVKTDDTLWGWGNNYSGELGVKTGETYINSPIKIMDNIANVYGTGMTAFAIRNDGTLWGWGENKEGLIYTGKNESWAFETYTDGSQSVVESVFTPVKLMDDVKKIAGRNHIAVIKKDNSLWVWGNNYSGELGDGTAESQNTPKKLLDNVKDATANSANTIVLKEDGSLWGCGTNSAGELGIGCFDDNPRKELIKITDNIALPDTVYHIPSLWAKDSVNQAIESGIVPEKLQSFYEKGLTRGEFVALISSLIYKLAGKDLNALVLQAENPVDINFTDTNDENIVNIAKLGIINGVGDNKFEPDGLITREQAAKILMETSELLGLPSHERKGKNFADDSQISEWAREGVYFCYENGIMSGTNDNNFSPKKTYSREMGIVTTKKVYELLNLIYQFASSPFDKLTQNDYQNLKEMGNQLFNLYDEGYITVGDVVGTAEYDTEKPKAKNILSKYKNDLNTMYMVDKDVILISFDPIFQSIDGIAIRRNNAQLKSTYKVTGFDNGSLNYTEMIPDVFHFTAGL